MRRFRFFIASMVGFLLGPRGRALALVLLAGLCAASAATGTEPLTLSNLQVEPDPVEAYGPLTFRVTFSGAQAPVRVILRLASGPDLTWDGRVAWLDRDFQVGYESAGVAFKVKLNGDLDPFVGPCGGGAVATTGEYEKRCLTQGGV